MGVLIVYYGQWSVGLAYKYNTGEESSEISDV